MVTTEATTIHGTLYKNIYSFLSFVHLLYGTVTFPHPCKSARQICSLTLHDIDFFPQLQVLSLLETVAKEANFLTKILKALHFSLRAVVYYIYSITVSSYYRSSVSFNSAVSISFSSSHERSMHE